VPRKRWRSRLFDVEADGESDASFVLDFFDEVCIVRATKPGLVGRMGAVLGRSVDEVSRAEYYAVAIDGEKYTWMLPLRDLAPTGKRRPGAEYFPE
jgi:hypothetical protein